MNQISHPKDYFELIEQIDFIANRLDLKIHPQCRIKKFEKQLNKFLSPKYNPWKDSNFNWQYFFEGIRDIIEICFICQQFSEKFPIKLKNTWDILMGGKPTPESDNNTHPRNIQFQLYFTSKLLENRFEVEIEEPDILFSHQQKKFGIAVKRLKSERKVKERVKEGVKQIEKSGQPGLVAISFDQLIQAKGWETIPSNYIFNKSIAMKILDKTLLKYENIILGQLKNHCIGYIGFLKVFFVKENSTEIIIDSAEKWVAKENDDGSSFDFIKSICNRISK